MILVLRKIKMRDERKEAPKASKPKPKAKGKSAADKKDYFEQGLIAHTSLCTVGAL
jgi:hypothetical protein